MTYSVKRGRGEIRDNIRVKYGLSGKKSGSGIGRVSEKVLDFEHFLEAWQKWLTDSLLLFPISLSNNKFENKNMFMWICIKFHDFAHVSWYLTMWFLKSYYI